MLLSRTAVCRGVPHYKTIIMALPVKFSEKLHWLLSAVYFFKHHFAVIIGLGFIAALGRTIQLGAFGQISPGVKMVLELVIESSRILIFLFVLGIANIKNGLFRIKLLLADGQFRKQHRATAVKQLKTQWPSILLNLVAFSVIAFFINYLIDLLAYKTCLYFTLQNRGIIAPTSSEWTIILFFKNISVIPFTLIFCGIFLPWITNRLQTLQSGKLGYHHQ